MKELLNALLDTSKERIKNPFIGAFLFAWIFFNWRPILYLMFSNSNIEEKIFCIDHNYAPMVNTFWWPLGSAIFFVVILQYLMWGFDRLSNLALEARRANVINQQKSNLIAKQGLAEEEVKLENIKADYRDKADLNKQIENLNIKLRDNDFDFEESKKENEILKANLKNANSFQILFARYGKKDKYLDVLPKVQELISTKGKFTVDNETFGEDPIKYTIKELQIIYSYNNVINSILATEDQIIELKSNELLVESTPESNVKQYRFENERKIGDIIKGQWTLTFSKDNSSFSEKAIVDSNGQYFSNAAHKFDLKNITIDLETKNIVLNKIDMENKIHSKEYLTIVNQDFITGTDSLGYKLEYKKDLT